MDILPYVADGERLPERTIYWEMGKQTAVRKGKWKLVLDGQVGGGSACGGRGASVEPGGGYEGEGEPEG